MDAKIRRGQVAIWIILGVFLASAIILFFLINDERLPDIISPPEADSVFDAQSFLSTCIEKGVEETVSLILPQGGLISPKNFIYFNGTRVEYICQNIGFYDPCIQQHPALLSEMREEIRKDITPKVWNCYNKLEETVREFKGEINIESGEPLVEVELGDGMITVDVAKKVIITMNQETRTFSSFDFEIKSSAYNLAMVAMEIAAQEAEYCYFEYVGYRILYPRYDIIPYSMSDPIVIYTIRDTENREYMMIAIRGCAIPAGI